MLTRNNKMEVVSYHLYKIVEVVLYKNAVATKLF